MRNLKHSQRNVREKVFKYEVLGLYLAYFILAHELKFVFLSIDFNN